MTLDIDWKRPRQLACPKKPDGSDERERLGWLKVKRLKRKPGKAHSTNKERSALARAKAQLARDQRDKGEHARKAYIEQVRAYWRGERKNYP